MNEFLTGGCKPFQAKFAEYLDGRLPGNEMQPIAMHLDSCKSCSDEFNALRRTQAALSELGPIREPEDLLLRIRVAVSQERARSRLGWIGSVVARWRLAWANEVGHYFWQFSAGLVSAVLLLSTVGAMVGIMAQPERARAESTDDVPLGSATAPRFLYLSSGAGAQVDAAAGAILVEVYVDEHGRAYDYRIVAGADDDSTRSGVEGLLLSSVFEPARSYGRPVRGIAVVSFVSVRG